MMASTRIVPSCWVIFSVAAPMKDEIKYDQNQINCPGCEVTFKISATVSITSSAMNTDVNGKEATVGRNTYQRAEFQPGFDNVKKR